LAGGSKRSRFSCSQFTVSDPGLTFLGAKGISNMMAGRLMLIFEGQKGRSNHGKNSIRFYLYTTFHLTDK
jgi:hypothetical protein